jgi:hypothetical protein
MNLPLSTRVWVFQSNRELTNNEVNLINQQAKQFVDQWTAHGSKLKADFEIRYNRFLILAADESAAMASGCSIDKSVAFMKELEGRFNLNLFDRMQVAFRKENAIETISLSEFQEALASGDLSEDTIVFNNLVQNINELNHQWEVPVKNSWHSRFVS